MTVKIQLGQQALQLGAEFKRVESELQKQILDLQLQLEQKKAHSEAAGMAFKRSLNFAPTLGADFACPDCWVRQGKQVAIAPISSGSGDDLFRCKDCGTELTVQV